MLSHQQINESTIPIPIKFVGFQEYGDLKIYRRHLPHWRQEGATYFVTFSQADAIPRSVTESFREKKQHWKRRLASKENIPVELLLEYEIFQKKYQRIIETSLDQSCGTCAFRSLKNRELLRSALLHFEGLRYHMFGFVIMPNHCHLLIQPEPGFALEEIVGSWKKYTSRRIEGESKPFWQDESHDRIIRDENHYRKAVRYIFKNPLKANLNKSCYDLDVAGVDLTALESRPTSQERES